MNLTQQDINDLGEGLKPRQPKVWTKKKQDKTTAIIDFYREHEDLYMTCKKFNLCTKHTLEILTNSGLSV